MFERFTDRARRVVVLAEARMLRIPFTPRAKKVLELGLREALHLGHDYIGTEHILLGLVREPSATEVEPVEEREATTTPSSPSCRGASAR